eukprot:13426_1
MVITIGFGGCYHIFMAKLNNNSDIGNNKYVDTSCGQCYRDRRYCLWRKRKGNTKILSYYKGKIHKNYWHNNWRKKYVFGLKEKNKIFTWYKGKRKTICWYKGKRKIFLAWYKGKYWWRFWR